MSDLKKVYVARGPGDAHVVRGLLESVGVRCVIRGDDLMPFQGGTLMHLETRPSLWVLEDDTYPLALEVVQDYLRRAGEELRRLADTWHCSQCHEEVEQQFSECWHCGTQCPS